VWGKKPNIDFLLALEFFGGYDGVQDFLQRRDLSLSRAGVSGGGGGGVVVFFFLKMFLFCFLSALWTAMKRSTLDLLQDGITWTPERWNNGLFQRALLSISTLADQSLVFKTCFGVVTLFFFFFLFHFETYYYIL